MKCDCSYFCIPENDEECWNCDIYECKGHPLHEDVCHRCLYPTFEVY